MLLGTRVWYSFAGAEQDDELAWEKRLENLCRELGDRGKPELIKPLVSEGVPPAAAPAAPATPRRAALAPAPAPVHTFSPSMQSLPPLAAPTQHQLVTTTTASFADIVSFMREERELMEAKMDAQRQETDKLREELKPAPARELISADELTELQARLERLELPDETKFEIENLLCDYLEIQTEAGGAITSATVLVGAASNTVGKMHKLVGVSQGLVSDATLSRRLKKQFDLK